MREFLLRAAEVVALSLHRILVALHAAACCHVQIRWLRALQQTPTQNTVSYHGIVRNHLPNLPESHWRLLTHADESGLLPVSIAETLFSSGNHLSACLKVFSQPSACRSRGDTVPEMSASLWGCVPVGVVRALRQVTSMLGTVSAQS